MGEQHHRNSFSPCLQCEKRCEEPYVWTHSYTYSIESESDCAGGGGGRGGGDGCGLHRRGADRCAVRRFTRRYRGVPWRWLRLNRRISTCKIIDWFENLLFLLFLDSGKIINAPYHFLFIFFYSIWKYRGCNPRRSPYIHTGRSKKLGQEPGANGLYETVSMLSHYIWTRAGTNCFDSRPCCCLGPGSAHWV